MLLSQEPPFVPEGVEAMTVRIDLPPGDPGSPPHRHSGPVFGYMLEGEMIFELEGEPERVIRAGEAFWEPGGDVIHYQAANNVADQWSRFVVVTDLKAVNFRANGELRKTGTRNLMDAALAAGVRRVVVQSIAWAYEAGEFPAAEDVPLDLGSSGNRLLTVQGVAALEDAAWGASDEYACKELNWTPAWPSWREGFAAL